MKDKIPAWKWEREDSMFEKNAASTKAMIIIF